MNMNISNAIHRTRKNTLDNPLVWIILGTIFGLIACKLSQNGLSALTDLITDLQQFLLQPSYFNNLLVADHRSGGAAVVLIEAVQLEAKFQGYDIGRWISRDCKYGVRGLYDKKAEKTDWVLHEMTKVAAK